MFVICKSTIQIYLIISTKICQYICNGELIQCIVFVLHFSNIIFDLNNYPPGLYNEKVTCNCSHQLRKIYKEIERKKTHAKEKTKL